MMGFGTLDLYRFAEGWALGGNVAAGTDLYHPYIEAQGAAWIFGRGKAGAWQLLSPYSTTGSVRTIY